MINKASQSKICVLIALLFCLNPVLATAGAFFSTFQTETLETHTLEPQPSELQTKPSCHQEKRPEQNVTKPVVLSESVDECCLEFCQCDDSGCHPSSVLFQVKSDHFFTVNQAIHYDLPIYLSLTQIPSSPPPIH